MQNHEAAEELTQDTFVEVYKSIHTFNEQCSLSTWIYRITVNKCLDYLKYLKRRKRLGLLSGLFYSSGREIIEQHHFDHPGIRMEQKENAAFLFEAIGSLPEHQRTAFILSQVEGLSQKEIADIMSTSVKAVESLIQRAKSKLRDKLGNIYEHRRKPNQSSSN